MTKKSYLLGLIILITLLFLADIYSQSIPCEPGLIVNACEFVRSIFRALGFLVILNYSIISLLLGYSFTKKFNTQNIKNAFFIFLISIIISLVLAPVEGFLGVLGINAIAQHRFKSDQKLTQENFIVSDLNEKPVIDKNSGKYSGIEISFSLTVKEPDNYIGSIWLTDPELSEADNSTNLFFDPNNPIRDDIVFRFVTQTKNEAKNFTYTLAPNKYFNKYKPDGPYYLTLFLNKDGNIGKSLSAYITSDNYYVRHFSPITSVVYLKELITRHYLFSDFN